MLGDERIIQTCRREFQGAEKTPFLQQCVSITSSSWDNPLQYVSFNLQKIVECIFNELRITNNNDIDEPAIMNFFDDNVKEAIWKPIFKSTFQECMKEITSKMPIITKTMESAPFNIRKDQCNVKYIAMVMCTEMKHFTVRFTQ